MLAVASLLASAAAATRPHYGGTLRVETRETIASLDPAELAKTAVGTHVARLLYQTLLRVGDDALARPALADSWSGSEDAKTWTLAVHRGARFSDGSPITAAQAAASVHVPGCQAVAEGNSIRIACELPHPHLPAELADARNSVAGHAADGSWIGSGPFQAAAGALGTTFALRANDNFDGGRPFVDAVQITTGRSLRDQALDFDLGKADVIEISPEQARRAAQNGARMAVSAPVQWMALMLQSPAASDDRVRQALSAAIDRDAIFSILLQRQGEPAGGLLPGWMTGYAFLFPTAASPGLARDLAAAGGGLRLTLAYDSGDSLAKLVAERVALNARDAEITLQPYGELPGHASNADIRLASLALDSPDGTAALAQLASVLDPAELPRVEAANSAERLYEAERSVLAGSHAVPLVYLPETLAVSSRVHDWVAPRMGGWPAANAWVEGQP